MPILPGTPTLRLKITSRVALSMSSLLDLTSAGPYAAAITCVFPKNNDIQFIRYKYLGALVKKPGAWWKSNVCSSRLSPFSENIEPNINKNQTLPCEKLADPSVLFKRHCSHRIDRSSDENRGTFTSASSAILNSPVCSRAREFLSLPRVGLSCYFFLASISNFFL